MDFSGMGEVSLKRGLVLLFKIAFATGLLFWLVRSGRLDFQALTSVGSNWHWFLAAQLVFGLVQWMTAVRWCWFLKIVGQHCTITRAFQLTLAGLLFNQVLIGSTGGDVYRVMAFDANNLRQRIAIAISVAMDRLTGLFALVVMIPIAALWNYSTVSMSLLLAWITAGSVLATISLPLVALAIYKRSSGPRNAELASGHPSKVARWLTYLKEVIALFVGHRTVVLKSIIFSLLIQAMIVVVNIFLAFSLLGTEIAWETFFLLIPIALLAMAVPINPPGALGTGEALYSILLEMVNVAQGGMISLLHRFTNILWALPGSLAFIMPARSDIPSNDSFDPDLDAVRNGK